MHCDTGFRNNSDRFLFLVKFVDALKYVGNIATRFFTLSRFSQKFVVDANAEVFWDGIRIFAFYDSLTDFKHILADAFIS